MLVKPLLVRALKSCSLVALIATLGACSQSNDIGQDSAGPSLDLRQKIAQKLMLDIRYFCPDMQRPEEGQGGAAHCAQPVTSLPSELATLISESDLGGIILFADNLESSAQMVKLNRALQASAAQSRSGLPLLIGIDQEGGRVNRLPRDEAAAFAGNMAIGATYTREGDRFARATAEVMADQLRVLGFNVNFAPTLDVNSNPDNPVINVRSYSETPQVVADLGAASVEGFQQRGVAATVKHFPGHGDTSVDSHTGLPRVERTEAEAQAVDLLPFKQVIALAQPALTMTAHIQYPSLDTTMLTSRSGEQMLAPATLSREILTGILRNDMGYQGVIVTDSLNMAGISDYFTPEEAVVNTFKAGADIALMPIKIRYPEDLVLLDKLVDRVVFAVEAGELSLEELDASLARVQNLKQQFIDESWVELAEGVAIARAAQVLATEEHRALADALASAALTNIFTPDPSVLPVIDDSVERMQILAPHPAIGEALRIALMQVSDVEVEVLNAESAVAVVSESDADALVVASIVPSESAVELGGMEDLAILKHRVIDLDKRYEIYVDALKAANTRGAKTVFVSMRSPYEAARFESLADVHLASFDYKAYLGEGQQLEGPIYHALARALLSPELSAGELPVTVSSSEAVHAGSAAVNTEG
ncbi:glycoside hydrolase family 3 N-terminal domain-containing protein [Microbulbifer agarilyticus]|uniref:glycoside hydrolase family 3 N-terminal domain-containing protein n=1 Tax=Microbulbifer agarilyticus TaxID=260552 RepID=UPI000984FAA4|nr:glycoside hydrolase family 3 N-terminal domain-containing protein [Microbulbifer agarilyticus]